MRQFRIGQPVLRVEDRKFITGSGCYTDDIFLPGMAYGIVLRSSHAHARIKKIDTKNARSMLGVLAIYTHEDIAHLGSLPSSTTLLSRDGSPFVSVGRPILAASVVRHVGESVAFIVGESEDVAYDAAEAIDIEYETLPVVLAMETAILDGTTPIHKEAKNNLCADWKLGDVTKTKAAFTKAARVVSIKLCNNRLVGNAIEPRVALGSYSKGRYTLYTSSQGSHDLKEILAKDIFRDDPALFRIVTPDVGGGFGTKLFLYPEHVMVLFASQQLGQPIKWTGKRSDSFLADVQGRDNVTNARIALDKNNRFLALEVDTLANLGGYASQDGVHVATLYGTPLLVGSYDIEAAYVRVRLVYTNTVPVDAYRGAGRPEASYVIERLVDLAAREVNLSPVELRRRNFINPNQLPYKTALGMSYDSGDFARNMNDALKKAAWDSFESRRTESSLRKKFRGIGISTYIEACAGGSSEVARLTATKQGKVILRIGTQSSGQGHATAYAQLIADRLGIAIHDVTVEQGDTDDIATGNGTGGSRSIPVGGAATVDAATKLIEKGKLIASYYLESTIDHITFTDGHFIIIGTNRSLSLAEVAELAASGEFSAEYRAGISVEASFKPPSATFPNGTHIAEVEIDPDTGTTTILRYTVVDDFGHILNPLLLTGQIHGGIAQGIGQALLEQTVYDSEGQLLTGSFIDYALPRAETIPIIDFMWNVTPCLTNPLGIKGAGEAGTIGAPPAIINAVVDALSSIGISHIDMPATPLAVWQAIQSSLTSTRQHGK